MNKSNGTLGSGKDLLKLLSNGGPVGGTFFSSDWHLGHANVIKYDKRPFASVEEMNEKILSNCEKMLGKRDTLYFLGDFALTKYNEMEKWMKRLAATGAQLYFIRGNHDKKETIKLYQQYGTYLGEQKKIRVGEQEIVLNHYAMRVWDKSHHGTWHLYGHSHHTLPDLENSLSFDVGCNGWDFKPIEFADIKARMGKKSYKAIDHHGRHTKD